jgi:heme-degrading monooxygenase HmoA
MILTVFRSRLTEAAGEDYTGWVMELKELAKDNPGFVDIKTYTADDGERLTAVRWRDKDTLRDWSRNVRHLEAKRLAREKWYQYFEIEVAEIFRTNSFGDKNTALSTVGQDF